MLRFAANLSMLYPEHAFLDRFAAAAQDGFQGVEFLFPYDHAPAELAARLKAHGLQQVLFNAPPGDWEAGERGLACLPDRQAEFRAGLLRALDYAQALDCPRIHVMAGIPAPLTPAALSHEVYRDNLQWACQQAEAAQRLLLIEPINTRDMPGYWLTHQAQAHALVHDIGSAHLKVQMDLYHCQIMEGDVATRIRHWLPTGQVGHFQIAGVPMRHEPDLGELNGPFLCQLIQDLAASCHWEGWMGLEYRPARGQAPGGTSAGLAWLQRDGVSRRAP